MFQSTAALGKQTYLDTARAARRAKLISRLTISVSSQVDHVARLNSFLSAERHDTVAHHHRQLTAEHGERRFFLVQRLRPHFVSSMQ